MSFNQWEKEMADEQINDEFVIGKSDTDEMIALNKKNDILTDNKIDLNKALEMCDCLNEHVIIEFHTSFNLYFF